MEINPITCSQSSSNNKSAISRGTSRRFLMLGALSLWLVVVCIVGAVEYQNRLQYERHATTSAENISQLLEQNISDIILKSDLAIYSVIHEAERQLASGHIDEHSMNDYINWQFSLSPDLDSIRIANADGDISYGIGVLSGIKSNIKDRDYFTQARQTAEPRLFISSPVIGRISGKWVIILARRLNRPDGGFAGVGYAVISLDHFNHLFSEVNLGEHGIVSLRQLDFAMVARYPTLSRPGTEVSNKTVSNDFIDTISKNNKYGYYRAVTLTDHIKRVFAYRQMQAFPGYIIVGIADADIIADWWKQFFALGGLCILFLFVLLAAAGFIARTMTALDRSRWSEEEARRYSELILASAGEGICGVDSSGRVTFINPAARRMLGWQEGEGAGLEFHNTVHHHRQDGSLYASTDCPMHKILQTGGQAARIEDEVYWRRDGSCFPVEYTLTPMIKADGTVGVVNVFRDITESVRAAEEITGLLSKLRAVLYNTPVGIAIIGFDRTIIEANEAFCRVYGRQGEDIIGQSARMLYGDPAQYEDIGQRAYPLVEQGLTFQDDVSMVRSDGSQIWARLVAHLVDVRHPEMGVVWAAEDISDRKALELELKRSNVELEQFAYVASHDLRQPLRMVISYMELLKRKLDASLDEEAQSFMGFAVGGAKRMDRLILDLLDYARIGKNTVIQAVSLTEAVQDALQNLEPAIKEAGAQITIMKDFPVIMGDIVEVTRLFQNLIGNAIKYRAQDRTPVIDVGWRASAGEWILWVKDNGIGIAPGDRDRAFQIFQRLVHKDAYEGSGIGLAVCQKIVAGHGGRIWIKSDNGEGTTFIFTLPTTA